MLTVDFSRLDLRPDSLVLDAGCGTGRHLSEAFRRRKVHVVGIDMNYEDSATARNTLEIMELEGEGGSGSYGVFRADITRLPFSDGVFDLVICSEVLEHIAEDSKAVKEITRVLKPGELAVVSVPRFLPESICWALSKSYRNEPGGHVRIYRKRHLVKLLESEGLLCEYIHWAHALHSPYWWLKCLVGPKNETSRLVNLYHRFLVWDIVKHPWLTRKMDKLLNPLIAKSSVFYLRKKG